MQTSFKYLSILKACHTQTHPVYYVHTSLYLIMNGEEFPHFYEHLSL